MIYHKPLMSGEWKWFSSEEKRNEYVLLNKPCLSVQNVLNISEIQTNYRLHVPKKELTLLAKQIIETNGTK